MIQTGYKRSEPLFRNEIIIIHFVLNCNRILADLLAQGQQICCVFLGLFRPDPVFNIYRHDIYSTRPTYALPSCTGYS